MLTGVSVDLGTVALLAIVVWLDGWRRLPVDAVLVERSGFGRWDVRAPWGRLGSLALVAWWAPLVVPLVLSPDPATVGSTPGPRWKNDFDVAAARCRRRLRRAGPEIGFLRLLGVLMIFWIIIGIPLVTARFGGRGLLFGVLGAFGLAVEITFVTTLALRGLGMSFRRSLRMTAQLLSPFTSPRAAEIVTAAAVGPLHSLAPLAALLGKQRFHAWVRPWAYDELSGRVERQEDDDSTIVNLVGAAPRHVLARAVEATAHETSGDGARYCPRCTRTYRESIEMCSNCSELALVAVPRGQASVNVE